MCTHVEIEGLLCMSSDSEVECGRRWCPWAPVLFFSGLPHALLASYVHWLSEAIPHLPLAQIFPELEMCMTGGAMKCDLLGVWQEGSSCTEWSSHFISQTDSSITPSSAAITWSFCPRLSLFSLISVSGEHEDLRNT